MKKFASSLFIYAGPLAYRFIHQNIPEALPCVRTVQNILYHQYEPITEGEFLLLQHLESYNAVKFVGEDATRVVSRVDYDVETDRLVGFVLPCTKDGCHAQTLF